MGFFSRGSTVQEYENRIPDFEQLFRGSGDRAANKLLSLEGLSIPEKVGLTESVRDNYNLLAVLAVLDLLPSATDYSRVGKTEGFLRDEGAMDRLITPTAIAQGRRLNLARILFRQGKSYGRAQYLSSRKPRYLRWSGAHSAKAAYKFPGARLGS